MKKTACFFSFLLMTVGVLTAQTDADSLVWSIELEDIVVTAQFAPTATENAVHEVKVIKASTIARQGMINLTEVLSQQLNFRINTDPILGNGAQIQGIGGENIQVAIDGVPVIGRVDGNIDLSQIRLTDVERIEIVEGALSAQYGNNAAGGVINIITKKSQLDKYNLSVVSQYENIGIQNYDALFSTRFKRFFLSLGGGYYQSKFAPVDSMRLLETTELEDGTTTQFRKNPWNPKLQHQLNGKMKYTLHDSAAFTYQQRYFNEAVFLYGPVKRPTFQPYAFDETYLTVRHDHSLAAEVWLSPQLYLKSQTAFNSFSRTKEYERRDLEEDTTMTIPAEQDTSRFNALLHRSILSTATARKVNTQVGIEYLQETANGRRIIDTASQDLNESKIRNLALWLGANWAITPTITLQGNLRYGYNDQFDHPLLPSLNLHWTINDRWTLKSSYAAGFRAPSLKELHFNFIDINHFIVGNPDLQAEYANNARASLGYNLKIATDQQLKVGAKFFYNKVKNKITLAEFAPLQFNYQNLENYSSHGLNLTANYQLKRLSVESGGSITYLPNEWANDDNNTPSFTPVFELQSSLSFLIPKAAIDVLATHRFIARQQRFFLSDDELKAGFIGNNHQINITCNRKFWQQKIQLSLGVKNLLNQSSRALLGGSTSGSAHADSGQSILTGFDRTYFARLQVQLGR